VLEGVVSKRRSSIHRSGNRRSWVKAKKPADSIDVCRLPTGGSPFEFIGAPLITGDCGGDAIGAGIGFGEAGIKGLNRGRVLQKPNRSTLGEACRRPAQIVTM
jgi:hypothetical protein